jgi:capsular exopolysaccharide synthesis family protein
MQAAARRDPRRMVDISSRNEPIPGQPGPPPGRPIADLTTNLGSTAGARRAERRDVCVVLGIWAAGTLSALCAYRFERQSVDLRDYIRVLRKGWAIILAFVIVGIGAGVALTLATKKVYQASTQLITFTAANADIQQLQRGNTTITSQIQSLTSIVHSPVVTTATIKALGLTGKLTPNKLSSEITADAPANQILINIHVTNHNPVLAARLTNQVATDFINRVTSIVPNACALDATTGKTVCQKSITVHVNLPAQVPSTPIKPNKIFNIGVGLAVGLLIGVGVVILRELLDNTVKGPADFEEIGMPVLGLVPFDKRTPRNPIAFRTDPHSARSEAYRQLRTNLQFVDVDNPPRIIAVTSAIPGEGKTTTAINLAAALAEAGSRVCLVEADLRRPSIAKALGLVGDAGFTTAVIGKAPVETVLQNAGRNLAVLTSGQVPPNPSELLISKHAKDVILELAKTVDFLIIDTPPLLPVTDGAELASLADATVLVHRASKTTRDQAHRSILALEKVGRRPVGVILNMIMRGTGSYDYEYAYYYTPYRPERGDGKGAHSMENGHDADSAPRKAEADADADAAADAAEKTAEQAGTTLTEEVRGKS